jgi:predicted nucleic acid-binding Zn ribbon protein
MLPLYQYQVINDQEIEELFEVEQKIDDAPLTSHPLTKEPVKRILTAASLSLTHSAQSERKSLASENLHKNGFTQYEKDSSSGDYYRTVGNQGPEKISPDEIEHSEK